MVICDNNFEYFKKYFSGNILEFDSFSLFGSHQNLIVAKFKCVNSNDFINKMITFKRMFCQIGAKEENYFTPHITLGKINNFVPSEERINTINKILSQITNITKSIVVDGCIMV
jgi:2'-5' RNA ligase